ncbi:GNAT family N-acetyltransferase [Herbaspirillum sp. 1130]|uniref:GNAT family N-acetyltransferase n=1 Tax=Herbaspirillum sp. 1130 TaxID=2806562 RepID=UPI001AE63F37|nr:GNAT family N-acetyltransferase [Herbaspirillum sp. 1130]MBP1312808.1 putative N-acyltransferase [Herbaspirillum sp. 1130]
MNEPSRYDLKVADSLGNVPSEAWQRLTQGNPFVGYGFLDGLQRTGCAHPSTGWYPKFLLLYRDGFLVGGAPCYFKNHSRGEFVFDHGWADAFQRHSLEYYPKLIVASPFTPVQGPRLLAADGEARAMLAQGIIALARSGAASSAHVLFVEEKDKQALLEAGFVVREAFQFHWTNAGYRTMDDFFANLNQEKRKKIRQDSRYVAEANIQFKWLEGDSLTRQDIEFFYDCYCNTYKEHWSSPYLSLDFFLEMHKTRSLHFVLVLAERDGTRVACALNVRGGNALYGRYWGTTEFCKGLHFETCYVQAIAYCIRNGIPAFEGGAQGEHKMARGLLPTKTYSAHWIANKSFAAAIENFLDQETEAIDRFVDQLEDSSPFRK